jgi:hypothetical protein
MLLAGAVGTAGCGGDAGMELAAGDAIVAVADQMQRTVQEYHLEVSRFDDNREDAVVAAFVNRVQADQANADAVGTHARDFQAALRKIREDRETESRRRTAAVENVQVLREMARGMQKLALESLSLRDEARRYLDTWIANQRRAAAEAGPELHSAASAGGAS